MRKRTNLLVVVTLLFILTGSAHSRMKLRVNQDFIFVSPPGPHQTVKVSGKPRSVLGAHPIKVTVCNRTGETSLVGCVRKNGSFSVAIKGYPEDKLRITFTAANGKEKTVKRRVPIRPVW